MLRGESEKVMSAIK